MADHVLLVMNLLVPSIRNADRILQHMSQQGMGGEAARGNLEPGALGSRLDPLLLVINRLGRDSGYLRVQDVEQTLRRKALAQIPDDWRTASRSSRLTSSRPGPSSEVVTGVSMSAVAGLPVIRS